MPYKSIHIVANGKILFFFMAEYCSIVRMYHIFFIHSSADGQLGCFHALPTVNNAAMNIRVCVSFHIELLGIFFFFGYIPRSGISGSYSSIFLGF